MPAFPQNRAASGIGGFVLEQECRCIRSPVPQVQSRKTPLSSRLMNELKISILATLDGGSTVLRLAAFFVYTHATWIARPAR